MKARMVGAGACILFVVLLCSCSREPEFMRFKVSSLLYDNHLLQFFVIDNMPEDPRELVSAIAEFNKTTIDIPDMLQKNYTGCYRHFFKKTYQSMRAFKEPDPERAWGSISNNPVVYGTYFDFNEGGVIKVVYRGGGNPSWEIENPTNKEVFYPWLRENDYTEIDIGRRIKIRSYREPRLSILNIIQISTVTLLGILGLLKPVSKHLIHKREEESRG
jgi:hypothetical protein